MECPNVSTTNCNLRNIRDNYLVLSLRDLQYINLSAIVLFLVPQTIALSELFKQKIFFRVGLKKRKKEFKPNLVKSKGDVNIEDKLKECSMTEFKQLFIAIGIHVSILLL